MKYVTRTDQILALLGQGEACVTPDTQAAKGVPCGPHTRTEIATAWGRYVVFRPTADFMAALASIHAHQPECRGWTILADESGSAPGPGRPMRLVIVIVPPLARLPHQDPWFHARDIGFNAAGLPTIEAVVDDVRRTRGTEILVFETESISTPSAAHVADGGARDPHRQLWTALRLALERVAVLQASSNSETVTSVSIYVEEAGPFVPGDPRLQTLLADWHAACLGRTGFSRLKLHGPHVVAKGTHPWMPYPDALGWRLSGGWRPDPALAARTTFVRAPTSSLVTCTELLARADRPQPFLSEVVLRVESAEVEAFGAFLRPAVRDAIARLRAADWDLLSPLLDRALRDRPTAYAAASLVLQETPIEVGPTLPDGARLAWYNTRIMAANHRADLHEADECASLARALLVKALPDETVDWFHIHVANTAMNRFDFEAAARWVEGRLGGIPEDGVLETRGILRSCRVQALAFQRRTEQALAEWPAAFADQRFGAENRRRQWIYRAHLHLDLDQPGSALECAAAAAVLAEEPGPLARTPIESQWRDAVGSSPFLHAVLLKAWALGAPKPEWWPALLALPDATTHPWPCAAFWAAILLKEAGRAADGRAACARVVEVARHERHALRGVRHASLLGALAHEGLVIPDAGAALRAEVLARGDAAAAWLGSQWPSEPTHFRHFLSPVPFNAC